MAAIEDIGSEGIQILVKALQDKDRNVRGQAAKALENIGPEAVPDLIDALKENDKNFRAQAAGTLRKINTPEAIKALKEYKKKSK